MAQLSAAGFVLSARGKSGGYRLARPAQDYSVAEILTVGEGSLAPVSCLISGCENAGTCLDCSIAHCCSCRIVNVNCFQLYNSYSFSMKRACTETRRPCTLWGKLQKSI